MKNFYTLLLASLLAFSTSNVLAQVPCSLSGVSNYIDFQSSSTIMMNVSVNGISQYSYAWNDGTPVGSSNQKPFYSGWCVTITDLMSGCDTIICESCIPTGGTGPCTMIFMPVCGCDGNTYSNDCIAMNNGIFTYTSGPCSTVSPSWDCTPGQGCYDPGNGSGFYTSLAACQANCSITPTWDCNPLQGCFDPQTGLGAYATFTDCDTSCSIVSPSWDCVNGACIDPNTGLGQYPSPSACLMDSCSVMPPAPSWDCVNGACIDPLTGNGQYQTFNDCVLDSCSVIPPVPSWDCDVMGICTDPGTGAGTYPTQAACTAACTISTVEEQTTNKKLLKVTDLLGRETKGFSNDVLFYIYDDGTVEKRIVIE